MKKQMFYEASGRIWRIPLFIGLFFLASSLYGYSNEQAKSFSIQLENVLLSDAISQIEKASGYSFFYDENKIDFSHRVSIDAQNQTVAKVLDSILKSTGLIYEISNNQIVLLPDERKTTSKNDSGTIVMKTQQQKGAIRGTVVDNLGEPVIGANIVEKGTTNGTITDVNGNFSLEVSPNAVLEVSFIGYITQRTPVKGTTVNITLREDAQALDEVVITGFGMSQKKESLTSAIAIVGADDIARSSSVSSSGALVGKVAGINARQTDGRPGSTTGIKIRNMGTPLYVIDGVQTDEGQFNQIDYNDIETISVLKDASASIYGVRAANGVIVVTTKKGKKNTKNTVSINARYGWQKQNFPRPADAQTYLSNYVQSETLQGVANRKYTQEEYNKWMQGTEAGYRPFDWYDFIWTTAPQSYVGANISGGSDKVSYYASLSNTNQQSIVRDFGYFNRTNVQVNLDSQINERFKAGVSINGRYEKKKNPGVAGGDDYWTAMFATYRNLPVNRPFANDNPDYPAQTNQNDLNFGMFTYDKSGYNLDIWRVMQLTGNLEYKILDGLTAKGLFGYYFADNQYDCHEYTYNLYDYDNINDKYNVVYTNSNPYRQEIRKYVEEYSSNIQLAYDKQFGKHKMFAMVGMEAKTRSTPSLTVNTLPKTNALDLLYFSDISGLSNSGNNTEARLGYMFRGTYDFASKYLVEFSARYDGSWKFPPNHRWGFFPSASLGWRMSEENFWKNTSLLTTVFSDFKIRGSYGLLGDDNTDGYSAFDYMSGYTYNDGGSTLDGVYIVGSKPRGLPVTTLSWIKAKTLDIGFDASFLNGRLSLTADYFRRIRTGLPESRYDVLIPTETGFSLPKESLNSDMTTGYDLALNWNDQVGDFSYSLGYNMTYARFYDWHQYKPRFSNSWDEYRNSKDERFGNLTWLYEAVGQFQSWDEIASYPIDNDGKGNKTLRPGDIKYRDVNGDGIINDMDKRPIGYQRGSTPTLNFAFNFYFNWKGFDLAFDLTGGAFNSYSRTSEVQAPFHGGGNNPQYMMEDTWHLSDIWDADSELIPGKYPTILLNNSGHSNYWESTFWTTNVRYLKMKNLEFGYNFPKVWLDKIHMSNLRVYFSAQNLFTLTNTDLDPEVDKDTGIAYPTNRVMSIGLNLKF